MKGEVRYVAGIAVLVLLILLEVEKSETLRTDLNVTAVIGKRRKASLVEAHCDECP